jgi:hypothetical protein
VVAAGQTSGPFGILIARRPGPVQSEPARNLFWGGSGLPAVDLPSIAASESARGDRVADKRIGPYPVEELIGWGGFASVYRSHGPGGTPLVLKVADQGGQDRRTFAGSVRPACAVAYHTGTTDVGVRLDPDAVREMFRAEAVMLRSAGGRRLPRLIDEQQAEDGSPVLVMEELTAPWSLGLAPIEDFPRILDACADLRWAGRTEFSRRGHGDLKPEHVFLDADGEFMFIDPSHHFGPFGMFGTLTPEYTPNPHLGAAARDACSTAVMVYQRLTGDFPWATPDWRGHGTVALVGSGRREDAAIARCRTHARAAGGCWLGEAGVRFYGRGP